MKNAKISITNSTVTIFEYDKNPVETARDELLRRLFHARHKATMGGVENWEKLLDHYYSGEYDEMIENISSFSGPGGATRNACIRLIKIIAKSEEVN